MNRCYNGGNMSAFSIPAAEHSTITAWGKEQEVEAYRKHAAPVCKTRRIIGMRVGQLRYFQCLREALG